MAFIEKAKGFFGKIPHTFYKTKYMVCRLWKEREGRSYILRSCFACRSTS